MGFIAKTTHIMGFKEENYTPKGLCICIFLWMMITCNHAFAQTATHCPIRVDLEPRAESETRAANTFRQNLFPFFNSWHNLNNLRLSDDSYTTVSLDAYKRSTMMFGSNMSLNIPQGAQITGLTLRVEGHSRGQGYTEGLTIQLLNYQGQRAGENKSLNAKPTNKDWLTTSDSTDVIWTYGGEYDNWGLDLNEFMLTNPNFGYAIQVRNKLGESIDVLLDNVQVIVHYIPLYSVCLDHACVPFYVDESEDPQVTYEWYLPQGWELISDSENDYAINIGPSYAEFGTYEICVESFYAEDPTGVCCRKFNYEDCNPGSISGLVFLDQNGNFVRDDEDLMESNVLINLYTSIGTLVSTTNTDNNGQYIFESVFQGEYYIEVELEEGLTFVLPNLGTEFTDSDIDGTFGDSTTGLILIAPGQTVSNIDAGLSQILSIGDFVWEDVNGDGIQQEDEPGIEGVTISISNNLIGTIEVTSDENGFYQINELLSSTYILEFEAPMGFESTIINAGESNINNDFSGTPIFLSYLNGGDIDSIDAGFFTLGSIGDFVWDDVNRNGIQDSTEIGLPGFRLNLRSIDGLLLDSTTTDELGAYLFSELPPAGYIVEVIKDEFFTLTEANSGSDTSLDSDGLISDSTIITNLIQINSGENRSDIDFGFYVLPVNISGFTWLDVNNDGQYQPEEPFIGDIDVVLYDEEGTPISVTKSDDGGFFEFLEEEPGTYYLQFLTPTGHISTSPNIGDDLSDSDVDGTNGMGTTELFTLLPGESSMDIAAGYQVLPSVSGIAWEDKNGDGIRQLGDLTLRDIIVNLRRPDSTILFTDTTDITGAYSFDTLDIGEYYLEFISENLEHTTYLPDTDFNSDVDGILLEGATPLFSLVGNQEITNIDAGFFSLSSISDFVWEDLNMNGIQETEEPGLADVLLFLKNDQGVTIFSRGTNETGFYLFGGLPPGDYTIELVPDSTYTLTLANQGDDEDTDSDAIMIDGVVESEVIQLISGDSILNIDFGFFEIPADVGGITWLDANNDGQYQNDESYIAGVEVSLFNTNDELVSQTTSNLAGFYNFTGVSAGEYYMQFELPLGHIYTSPNIGNDNFDSDVNDSFGQGTTGVFTLNPGDINMTIAAGYQALPKVGDFVWLDLDRDGFQDSDEPGLNGITVTLFSINGLLEASTITTNNPETGEGGYYLFDTLLPGDYYIQFEDIDTLDYTMVVNSESTLNSDVTEENETGSTSTFSLIGNECNLDIDAGYILTRSNIQGEVWVDSDEDGIQNPNDLLLENVTVRLFNTENIELGSTTTDSIGQYIFTEIEEGTYYIVFDTTERYTPTLSLEGTDTSLDSDLDNSQATGSTRLIMISNGINIDDIDAGLIDGSVTINGFTWTDSNNDGLREPQELALDSIEVKLFSLEGSLLDSTLVDENGFYAFENTLPGDYYLVFENLDPTFFNVDANQGDDNIDDDITNDITVGSTDTIFVNFFMELAPIGGGYYQLGGVGDMVFIDENENGINDDGRGINGVVLNLLNQTGEIVGSTVTAQGGGLDSGFYFIDNIVPGIYSIQVLRPLFYQFTDANIGSNDSIDSDINLIETNLGTTDPFEVTSGSINTNIDAGLVFRIPMESSISGTIWNDENSNGTFDMGEAIRSGVIVALLDSEGNVSDTRLTDSEGQYTFDLLQEGFYSVRVGLNTIETATIPDIGTDDTIDSDFFRAMGVNVETQQFFLANFEDKEFVDLGVVSIVNIGDFVWEDLNNNGTQELDEPGVANIAISITDSSGTIQESTLTDDEGIYEFTGLPAGTYQVCVTLPEGYFVGQKNTGILQLDSDANEDGCTDFLLFSGGTDNNIDIALTKEAAIEGVAFTDLNGNGVNNLNDPDLDGIQVFLFSSDGTKLDSTLTFATGDTTGYYLFDGLIPSEYYIQFIFPDEYILSDGNVGSDDIDSDISNAFGTGTTDIITLASGEIASNTDGGAYLPACIGDRIWEDLDKNGLQDEGEAGVGGIEVIIFRSFGVPFDTVVTNQLGEYKFSGLKQGLYFIQFMIPQEYTISLSDVGIDDLIDSDADETGKTPLISLAHGADLTSVDCGIFTSMASLRSVVWEDLNGDGMRQAVEARIPDIRVTLFDENDNAIRSTVSNSLGLYAFQEIPEGNYKVFVDLDNTDYAFTTIDMSTEDLLDSDIHQNGESDIFESAEVLSVPNVDVGLVEMGSIGGVAWNDVNQNGLFDIEESTIPNIKVRLYDSQDNMVSEVLTSSDGEENFFFSNLRPGGYHMEYKVDKDFVASMENNEVALDNNSDIHLKDGKYQSPKFIVSSANTVTYIDAGFYKKTNIAEELIVSAEDLSNPSVIEVINESSENTEIINTDIEEPLEISIYPNPATNYIKLEIANKNNAIVRVLNGEKKVVLTAKSEQLDQLNISDLHPGIYYIVVEQDGKSVTKKFIKVH